MSKIPQGLIVKLVTPLSENKAEPDLQGLKKLLEQIHNSPVLINGTVEDIFLSNGIRESVVEKTMRVLNGRTVLIAGITGKTADETFSNVQLIENLREKMSYNGEMFLFDFPLWYHSNRGLPRHYDRIAELTPLPVILFNNPAAILQLQKSLKRHNIRTNVFKKLSDKNQIAGLGHDGTLQRFLNYIKAGRNRFELGFYDGNELNFLDNPGSGGVISIGANLMCKMWKEVVDFSLIVDETTKKDAEYSQLLWGKMEVLKQLHQNYRAHPESLVKAGLKHMGMISSDVIAGGVDKAGEKEKQSFLNFLESCVNKGD